MNGEEICDIAGCSLEPSFLITFVESGSLRCEKFFCDEHARPVILGLQSKAGGRELPKYATGIVEVEIELIVYSKYHDERPACIYLQEIGDTRRICMTIDPNAWSALIAQLRLGHAHPPLTHYSWAKCLKSLNSKIEKIILDQKSPSDGWWYATITLLREAESIYLDVRPSDAIILALITNSPLFITMSAISSHAI